MYYSLLSISQDFLFNNTTYAFIQKLDEALEKGNVAGIIAALENCNDSPKTKERTREVLASFLESKPDILEDLLCEAIEKKRKEIIAIFLNKNTLQTIIQNSKGGKLLYLACKEGYSEIVKLFLEATPKENKFYYIETKKFRGENSSYNFILACEVACQHGHLEIVKLFFDAYRNDANMNIKALMNFGGPDSTLVKICEENQPAVLAFLLQEYCKNIHFISASDYAFAIYTACNRRQPRNVELLLSSLPKDPQANSEIRAFLREFYLGEMFINAVSKGYLDICRQLLKTFNDPAEQNIMLSKEQLLFEIYRGLSIVDNYPSELVELLVTSVDSRTILFDPNEEIPSKDHAIFKIVCKKGHAKLVDLLLGIYIKNKSIENMLVKNFSFICTDCIDDHTEIITLILERVYREMCFTTWKELPKMRTEENFRSHLQEIVKTPSIDFEAISPYITEAVRNVKLALAAEIYSLSVLVSDRFLEPNSNLERTEPTTLRFFNIITDPRMSIYHQMAACNRFHRVGKDIVSLKHSEAVFNKMMPALRESASIS
jgi:ankyrin repeat protein